MENVSISQILVNVMMVGKDIYVMNQVASKFHHYKSYNKRDKPSFLGQESLKINPQIFWLKYSQTINSICGYFESVAYDRLQLLTQMCK